MALTNLTTVKSNDNQPRLKKFYIFGLTPIILIISGLSAWRFLVILKPKALVESIWLPACFGLTIAFILFWIATLRVIHRLKNNISTPAVLTALVGAGLFGLAGLLLTTPTGLSRISLELQAENVWDPNIFTAIWTNDGLWDIPFTLPTGESTPVTLEITAQNNLAEGSEVWLVGATWPDGSTIPFDEFQATDGWNLLEIDWASYKNRPLWISTQNQPAILRWTGLAPGPLTLIFARHNRAGQVSIHWNGNLAQTFDLYASDVGLQGLTLPANQPVVWQANLPFRALTDDIGLSIEPDPLDGFSTIIKKVSLVGIPGQSVAVAGEELGHALHFEAGQTILSPAGLQFLPDEPDEPLQTFLVDSLVPASNWVTILPWLENILVVLYLAIIGGLALGSLANLLRPDVLAKLNIVVLSILAALFIGEMGLRLYLPAPDKYYVWRPKLYKVFKPSSTALPGIEGEARFIINSQGIRADEFSSQDDYRILVIGGSTAESLFLDQSEAWPQLLQNNLNNNHKSLKVWVGNVGKAGRNTREHILQMKHLLPQHTDLDAVLLLIGVNDFILNLELDDAYNPNYLTEPGMKQTLIKRSFDVYPKQDPNLQPYYRQTATAYLADRIQQAWRPVEAAEIEIQNEDGSNVIRRRQQRKEAVIKAELADLSAGLEEYSRNVNSLIDIAQAHQLRIILMTQPSLWRPDLSQAEKDLLWLGWGPLYEYFYSANALTDGMAAYNEKLLEICANRQVDCLDLATALPKNQTVFYDDVHFNESGSSQVANIVAEYLLKREPFAADE